MASTLRKAVAALVVAAVVAGILVAPAGAARSPLRTICERAQVVEQPRGLVVGYLSRGTQVVALRHTTNHYWTRVRSTQGIVGWIRTSAFC